MIRIVSDSSALYSKKDGQAKGVTIAPLIVTINGKTYREYEDISTEEFINIINEGHIPVSSQPAIGEVLNIYDENIEDEIKEDEYIQYLKAQSQIEAKKYEDAIFTLTNITKLHGDNPFFFFDIACCYQGLGNEKMYKYYCEKRDEYWKNHKND